MQNGGTALVYAAAKGHTDTVELLLQRGADINLQDKVIWVRAERVIILCGRGV
jgi:hypothetical protein